jgi:polyribonucleotide nucleotidyltransferase
MPDPNGSVTDAIRVSGPVNAAGTTMSFETGRLAKLADGAVLVGLGDTTVLTTVVTSTPREGIDFFPLTLVLPPGRPTG